MLTLIFNGSPRQGGDTAALIRALTGELRSEWQIIDTYDDAYHACVDCRACATRFQCAIDDAMRDVYPLLLRCDGVVIASPIYFSQLTGRVLDVFSRFQPGYYARRRGEQGFFNRRRRGGLLLAGGGDGSPEPALATARTLLHQLNAREIAPPVMSLKTDRIPAANDEAALSAARALARFLEGAE